MAVISLTDQNFEEMISKSAVPVMVDYYADWCGPCRMAAPIIDEISETYKDKLMVGKVDVDTSSRVASKFNVMSIPTVILFKDGKEVERRVGFGGKELYLEMITKYIAK